MKTESGGLGLYPIIFMVIFIRRYLAGMDITNAHNWIGIAISSFFWWVGMIAVMVILFLILAIIKAITD